MKTHVRLDDARTLCGKKVIVYLPGGYIGYTGLESVDSHEPDRNPDGHDWCCRCIRRFARAEWMDGNLVAVNVRPLPKMWKRRGY